jgi:hypothetical protein
LNEHLIELLCHVMSNCLCVGVAAAAPHVSMSGPAGGIAQCIVIFMLWCAIGVCLPVYMFLVVLKRVGWQSSYTVVLHVDRS